MNGHHFSRADFSVALTLLAAWSLQDYATAASLFAFAATGIYYVVKIVQALKRKEHD